MNKRTFILFLLIAPVLLASGCDDGKTKTDVVSTDMLIIEDIHAIPSQTVRDGDTIVIRMDVTNKGQKNVWMLVDDTTPGLAAAAAAAYKANPNPDNYLASIMTVFDGDMVLVNHCDGLYELQDGGFDIVSVSKGDVCETPDTGLNVEISDKTLENPCYVKFVPEQTHVFQWTIKAPSNEKLHGLTNECTFNFQTIYAGIAETITYVYFAIPHEVAQRIYTKNDLTLVGDNIASYGPVVANFETGEKQPIRAGEKDTWTVYLNLKNHGNGVAKIKDIELIPINWNEIVQADGYDCELCFPKTSKTTKLERSELDKELQPLFDKNRKDCKDKYKDNPARCDRDDCYHITNIEDKNKCSEYLTLRNKLEIFETESSRISCTFTAPDDVNIMQPYKFVTRAKYAYSQGRDFKIKTEPKP